MNTPVPPTPPSSAALQAILQSAASTGTVTQTGAGQPPLQAGEALLATVVARATTGQFILQTDAGQLTLQTAANLLNGTVVSLQVQLAGARPQVLIQPGSPPAAGGQTAAPAAPAAVVTTVLTEGSTATATVLRSAGAGAQATGTPASGAAAPAPQGGTGAAPVPGATPSTAPGSGAATAGTTIRSAGTVATTAGAPGPLGPAAPATPIVALPAGATLPVRILSIVPPGASPAAAHPGSGSVVTGTVTGVTASGQTVIESQLGEIALDAKTALPRGTAVALQLSGAPRLPATVAEGSLLLSSQWEALRAAYAALQASDPTAARALAQQALPQPAGGMTTGMLFFLSAMLSGDLRRWIGEEAARALQRAAPGVLDRLGQDFGEMRRMATEPAGQEWRTYLIPLLVGGSLEQIRLFVRGGRDDEAGSKDDKDRGTRFVIEVEFSRLGPFQFDGLTRGKSINLLVRTRDPLTETMRDDIRRIYTSTVSALGFTGTIDFQRSQSFELNPTREVHARHAGGVMV